MCGIIAAFAHGGRPVPPLSAARDLMTCRGPDSAGLWTSPDGRATLGQRRLAIIDLSPLGAQPMHAADGRYSITFNGEIYNYRELRAGLEARGVRFRSHSDTEVLLALYAEKGAALVHDLRGMFAFAIHDSLRGGMLLARDHFGIKPLYVAATPDTVYAASEVKALRILPGVDLRPEPAGHVGFMLWGHVPDPYTMFRGIRALPAGHTMWVDGEGAHAPERFADVRGLLARAESLADGANASDVEVDAQLRQALADSVRHHLIADVEVGVFLSAGLDSTTIAALAADAGGRLRTVTLGFSEFQGSNNDEVPLAEATARTLGAEHTTVWVTREDFRAQTERLLDRMDQPTLDGVNSYFVAKAAADCGLKVALSGLGGDELFGGYPSFTDIPRIMRTARRLPGAATGVGRALRVVSAPVIARMTSPKFAGLFEYGSAPEGAYLLRRGLFMPWELPTVLDPDLVREGWAELHALSRLAETTRGLRGIRTQVSALETTWYMRNQLLRDTDWASMSHSLEVRVPFVDWTLWSVVAPMVAAAPTRVNKARMATVAAPALAPSLLARPKSGFSIPVRDWLDQGDRARATDRGLRGWARAVYERYIGG